MKLEKDEVLDIPFFHEHNDDEFTIENKSIQNVDGILAQNKKEREDSNGFSDKRTMRKFMSLPIVEYLNAIKLGYKLDTDDPIVLEIEAKRYYYDKGKDGGYGTVKNLSTPGHTGHIIIK